MQSLNDLVASTLTDKAIDVIQNPMHCIKVKKYPDGTLAEYMNASIFLIIRLTVRVSHLLAGDVTTLPFPLLCTQPLLFPPALSGNFDENNAQAGKGKAEGGQTADCSTVHWMRSRA